MKFRVGDRVIYINNYGDWFNDAHLKIGNQYIIRSISHSTIYVNNSIYPYNLERFISVEEYRRMKINKIKDGISSR